MSQATLVQPQASGEALGNRAAVGMPSVDRHWAT